MPPAEKIMTTIIVKKGAALDAAKKINSVFGLMAKKDSAVISVRCAIKTKKDGTTVKGVSITHFNGSTQIVCSLTVDDKSDVESGAGFNVGAEFISAILTLGAAKGDEITITDGGAIKVSVGGAAISVKKKTEGVMPIKLDVTDPSLIEGRFCLKADAFKGSAQNVLFAALNDDSAVGGVGIVANADCVFRATDRHRLAESSAKIQQSAFAGDVKEIRAVVSPSVLKCVTGGFGKEVMVFVKTKNHLTIQVGADIWQMPVLDKDFPHKIFEGVKAMKRGNTVSFNKAELLTALDIVNVGAASVNDAVCQLTFEGTDKMVVSSRDGGNHANVGVKVEGDVPAATQFSIKLLKTVVGSFKGDAPIMELSAQAPSAFYAEGENFYAALCPVADTAPAKKEEKAKPEKEQ